MSNLDEIKSLNADLPLTNFPNEVDDFESFSDADDEINSVIIKYKNLLKQGETAKAEEIYEQYSLKKYIVSAYFLNKIQQMIIACERSISSVKKYFSFSDTEPTSNTTQPNGYIWAKILSAGDNFKKVIFKLKENDSYVNIYPRTIASNVIMAEDDETTVTQMLETKANSIHSHDIASNTSDGFMSNNDKIKLDSLGNILQGSCDGIITNNSVTGYLAAGITLTKGIWLVQSRLHTDVASGRIKMYLNTNEDGVTGTYGETNFLYKNTPANAWEDISMWQVITVHEDVFVYTTVEVDANSGTTPNEQGFITKGVKIA